MILKRGKMSISAIESENQNLENNTCDKEEQKDSSWNGRMVVINAQEPKIVLCSNIVSSAIGGYFNSDKRKQNEFDIKIYQHHVRCNSEESKQHLERAFEKMAIGVLGIVIGVARFMGDPVSSAMSIYFCREQLWMGVEEFKKAMETRNMSVENITFVTNAEDLKRNTEELVQHGIIPPSQPFGNSSPRYTDTPNYVNPLDTNNYHQPRNFNHGSSGHRNHGKKETQFLPYA